MRKIICLFSFVCLLLGCIKDDVGDSTAIIEAGDHIPAFSVVMDDGSTLNSSDLQKGIACIMFFDTSCQDCRDALAQMQQVYNSQSVNGVKFALISREESAESIILHWQENGYTMPYSAQNSREIYSLFAKSVIPRIYICKEGIVTATFSDTPAPTATGINSAIDALK